MNKEKNNNMNKDLFVAHLNVDAVECSLLATVNLMFFLYFYGAFQSQGQSDCSSGYIFLILDCLCLLLFLLAFICFVWVIISIGYSASHASVSMEHAMKLHSKAVYIWIKGYVVMSIGLGVMVDIVIFKMIISASISPLNLFSLFAIPPLVLSYALIYAVRWCWKYMEWKRPKTVIFSPKLTQIIIAFILSIILINILYIISKSILD